MAQKTRPARPKIEWPTVNTRFQRHEIVALTRLAARHGLRRSIYLRELALREIAREGAA